MVTFVRLGLRLLRNHHNRLSFLLFSSLVIAQAVWSQTNTAISRDFDKEMVIYRTDNTDTTLRPTSLSKIPNWMNSRFPEQGDTLYVFGISDPGLNDTIARQQAIFRGMALCAMAKVTDCEHFSDFYSQAKGAETDSKYEEIYRFSADFSGKSMTPVILNDTILSSSEAIVLMGIPTKNLHNSRKKNMRIEAVLYNNEADIMYGNKMSRKVDINILKRDSNEKVIIDGSYFYQMNGRATDMRCLFPQSQAVYNRYEFYYNDGASIHQTDSSGVHGTTCKQGLWIAYVSEILDYLSMQTKMLSNETQVVRDKTEDSSLEILRERSRTRLLWKIRDIDIYDNKMRVNLTISTY